MDAGSLLAAIAAHPDEDDPRLVYADWLAERGDPRGELIAIQCALAGTPAHASERTTLELREKVLLAANAGTWAAELGLTRAEAVFRRGFVDELHLDQSRLAVVGTSLPRWPAPVRSLRIHGALHSTPARVAFLELRSFGHVVRLSLTGSWATDADVVTAIENAPPLRSFSARGRPTNAPDVLVRAIVDAPWATELEHLGLSQRQWTAETAEIVRKARRPLVALRWLDVSSSDSPLLVALALLDREKLPSIERLDLSGSALVREDAAPLLRAAVRLRSLDVARNTLAFDGAAATALASTRLEELRLASNPLGDEGVAALALAAPETLTTLDLFDCGLTDRGIASLASAPRLANLRSLSLGDNTIGPAGADALLGSPHLGGVTCLNLRGAVVDEDLGRRLRARFGRATVL